MRASTSGIRIDGKIDGEIDGEIEGEMDCKAEGEGLGIFGGAGTAWP
jgi:hypothetical protein